MLYPHVAALKKAAIQVCRIRSFSFTNFMEDHGLEDILESAQKNNTPALEMVADLLSHCCRTEDKFNNFQVGLLTAMKFIREYLGPLGKHEQQAFKDEVLKKSGSRTTILQWLSTHYPQ